MLILIVLALLVSALFTRPVQTGLKTTVLLIDLGVSYKWKASAIPRSFVISQVTYPCNNREIVANLYRPGGIRQHPGIILAHGAVKDGKDDPALLLAGPSLARAGYVVLVPQLDNLAKFQLHPDDIETLVASFKYLSEQEFCNKRIGMLGVCLSAPLVLLAAAEPSISRNVAIIGFWGGYYNIKDWLQSVITKHYIINEGQPVPWEPRSVLTEKLPAWLTEFIPDSPEKFHLKEIFSGGSADFAQSKLSPEGQALHELLASRDPARARELWTKLHFDLRQALDNLSPHLKIDQLHAKIAIIHTFTDDVIPWVESVKLAQAVNQENKIYYRIFHQFYHVRVEDLFKLRLSNMWNVIFETVQFYLFIYHFLYSVR